MRRMHRAVLADIELEYEITGTGEHVVLIHHGVGTGSLRCVMTRFSRIDIG